MTIRGSPVDFSPVRFGETTEEAQNQYVVLVGFFFG
jgi:hypothetical protein